MHVFFGVVGGGLSSSKIISQLQFRALYFMNSWSSTIDGVVTLWVGAGASSRHRNL